jgi:hypothetical protein
MKQKSSKLIISLINNFAFAFLALVSWWQISPLTLAEFDSICKETNYDSCMKWYWQTKNYFTFAFYISLAILLVSLFLTLFLIIKNKTKQISI